jgi:hypothetical protein
MRTGIIKILCTPGYEPSPLCIRNLLHRTGAYLWALVLSCPHLPKCVEWAFLEVRSPLGFVTFVVTLGRR